MPASVTIEPWASTIDMYDSPDTSSAYSLSGHITVKLTPSSSVFGFSNHTTQNLLLTSLELTFEGQSELVLNDVGYVPLRILTITKELVLSSQPVHINSDEEGAEWRIVFNMAIPGWLPATCAFGDAVENQKAGVNYALFARAKFLSANYPEETGLGTSTSSSSVWNSLCSVMRFGGNRHRVIHAEKSPIYVRRYVSPPAQSYEDEDVLRSTFPTATYAIQALPESGPATNIPAEVLRFVQLHVILPGKISTEDDHVPVVIRLRSRSEDAEIRNRLKVYGFEADIMQMETYYTSPSRSYAARFPLPPEDQQPPTVELKAPHAIGPLFDLGLIPSPLPNRKMTHARNLVPSGANRVFKAQNTDGSEGGVKFEENWIRMGVEVSVLPGLPKGGGKRVTMDSPLFAVTHEVRLRVTIGYELPNEADDDEEERQVFDELVFTVPLQFAQVTPETVSPSASTFFPVLANLHNQAPPSTASLPYPHPPMTISHSSLHSRSVASLHAEMTASHISLPSCRPSTPFLPPPLPAYNQLYHENGDRKDDLLGALPVYRQKEESSLPPPSIMMTMCQTASESTFSIQEASECPGRRIPESSSSSGLPSPPESPVTPDDDDSPVTPPGLLSVPSSSSPSSPQRRHRRSCKKTAGGGKKSEQSLGESFLSLDEGEPSDIDLEAAHRRRRHHREVNAASVLSTGGDVEYGLAL